MKFKLNGIWVIVSGVLMAVLAVLFMLQCGPNRKQAPCPEIKVDTLFQSDTILIPDTSNQKIRWVPKVVDLTDTAKVRRLIEEFDGLRAYYSGLVGTLQDGLLKKDSALTDTQTEIKRLQLLIKTHVYEDSVRAVNYAFKFRIEAMGDIKSFTYGITPNCPTLDPLDTKKPKDHRIGIGIGGQAEAGAIRPIYLGKYQYKWVWTQVGYLPGSKKLDTKDAIQLSAGFTFGIK